MDGEEKKRKDEIMMAKWFVEIPSMLDFAHLFDLAHFARFVQRVICGCVLVCSQSRGPMKGREDEVCTGILEVGCMEEQTGVSTGEWLVHHGEV